MAGYLINLDSEQSLEAYIANGVYSTRISDPANGVWRTHHEGTFGDYATMKAGDNIYFFIKRKIYGIGELVNVGQDCKYLNFPNANKPIIFDYQSIRNLLLLDEGDSSINQRWICLFKPTPHFFHNGIDMDEVLSSNPSKFRMLRAFWKVSFIKIDDEENQAFKDIILKKNQNSIIGNSHNYFLSSHEKYHKLVEQKLQLNNYNFSCAEMLSSCSRNNAIGHEMAIEAGLLYQLAIKDLETINIFGAWDYLSQQVIASPHKPVDYMDKMDIFGYSYIPNFEPTKSKYLVLELKKDIATQEDIEQLLKYIDWVNMEYAYGDYSMIHAYLVAHDFSKNIDMQYAKRQYTIGTRPAQSKEWNNLSLVKYFYDSKLDKLIFNNIN